MATYKQGSDIIETINFVDENGDSIAISGLVGYGIEVFDPSGASVGKWGSGLTGYSDPTGVFDADGPAYCTLKIDSATYGTNKGVFKGELYISYTDADFSDSLRHLYSEKKELFTIR